MRMLTGVYKAVCLEVVSDTGEIRCHVPQVFADEVVTCFDNGGGLPRVEDEGWVAFESSFPDRPVWIGTKDSMGIPPGGLTGQVLTKQSDEDFDGVWQTPSGGAAGSNEVWIGPNDPIGTFPTIEFWYDTDAPSIDNGGVPRGGTAGQVLSKNTGADFDTKWVAQTGGSTVTAGAGLVQNASAFDVGAGTGIIVSADSLAVDTSVIATKAYADSVGGTDDVWIGPDDPIATKPTIELWYDTDEPAVMPDDMRWYTAWGVVATATVTTGQSGIGTTVTDVNGLTVTFTPVAGRRYRTVISWLGQVPGASTSIVPLITDGANAIVMQRYITAGAAYYVHAFVEVVESGLAAVSTVRKARLSTTAGTTDVLASAAYSAFISVEDVGPVGGAAVAVLPPGVVTAWTPLPFATGWGVWSGGSTQYGGAAYRKNGDNLEVRGLCAQTGGTTTIATLPVGFRPAYSQLFVCYGQPATGSLGSCRVDIQQDGAITLAVPPPGGSGNMGYLSLNMIACLTA